MPAALVQHTRALILLGAEMGPKSLVEREQALSHGAGQHFQRKVFIPPPPLPPPQVHRLLTTVSGKQKSLVIFTQNVMILKAEKKPHQPP